MFIREETPRYYSRTDSSKTSVGENHCGEVPLTKSSPCVLTVCRSEDDHVYSSFGQCTLCGAHRRPGR